MKKNYVLAIIGAILGALVGTIPWVLMYVYGGYILSVLAFVIAFCSYKGYLLLGGENSKYTWILIVIVSFLAITFSTFITIPLLLILKNGNELSLSVLKDLYLNSRFTSAIIKDYFISLVFTFLGISGVIKTIKNDLNTLSNTKISEEEIEKIFAIFKSHQAISKKNAITKWDFEKEIDGKVSHDTIHYLKRKRVIVGQDKLYLDELAYTDPEYAKGVLKKTKRKVVIITIFLVILIVFVFAIFNSSEDFDNNSTNNESGETKKDSYKTHQFLDYVSYQLPEYLTINEENTDSNYYNVHGYYTIIYTPLTSYRGETIFKTIYADYLIDYYYDDFSEYKDYIYEQNGEDYNILDVKLRTDINDYEVIEIKATGTENRLYFDYYIFHNNDSLFLEFISYDTYSSDLIEEELMKILKSVDFNDTNNIQKS